MSQLRIAIAGATGYTGEELIRLLLHHPNAQLTQLAASAKWDRPTPVSDVFPRFVRQLDLPIEALNIERLIATSDCVFLALPHGTSMALAPKLVEAGKRVIDLSGDFRLTDPAAYPRWYAFDHADPSWLTRREVVYGLTEFHREEIRSAALLANPGCYATSILLGCLPLFRAKLAAEHTILVDAKSGLSGAGRKADASLLFTEMTENLRAYKINNHQHMPEVLQEVARVSGRAVKRAFAPLGIPASRGLISTIYDKTAASLDAVAECYRQAYPPAQAPFVRVRTGSLPQLRDIVETNYCDIGLALSQDTGTLIIGSALDNLVKGAAGQAIQNMNLMYGFPETAALL